MEHGKVQKLKELNPCVYHIVIVLIRLNPLEFVM